MHRIVFALDSFKGSLTSCQAGDACAAAARELLPGCDVTVVPVADGGEGTVEALAATRRCTLRVCDTVDPLGRPVRVRYALAGDTAFMSMADASGLPLLAESERNPLLTSSRGTGIEIADAIAAGARHIVIGAGGSATVDCGTGLLYALGFRFLDRHGAEISPAGGSLTDIASVIYPRGGVAEGVRFTVLCDVDNPLSGPRGAAPVFAPQKGADSDAVRELARGLDSFSRLMPDPRVADMPGAGAAGGATAGMMAFLGAEAVPGAEAILAAARFADIITGASLVVTGEGRMDATTLGGKTPYAVLKAAKAAGVPVMALAGSVADRELLLAAGFARVESITPAGMPLHEAMRRETATANLGAAMLRLLRH